MLTYTTRRNLYGNLTNDSSSANLTLGDTLLMDAERTIVAMKPWSFLEKSSSASTVASTQFYNLPNDCEKLISSPTITISSKRYTPKLAPAREFWDQLNASTSPTSNIPEYYFVFNKQVGFWPIPATSTSNAITFLYRKRPSDINRADYTTGTITTVAALGTAVTGSGTSWAAGMIGSYIRITGTTAANTGDDQWYEITAVGSTTTLTIARAYQGTAIAAGGASYTIGQPSVLPEGFDILPVFKAAQIYFSSVMPEPAQAQSYSKLYDEKLEQLVTVHGRKTDDVTIEQGDFESMLNPNLTITI